MRILDLPLKKEWYNMIEAGEKLEEYRELTAYWIVRLLEWNYISLPLNCANSRITGRIINKSITMAEARMILDEGIGQWSRYIYPKRYDAVRFSYGYTKRRMMFECSDISIGRGRPEWARRITKRSSSN